MQQWGAEAAVKGFSIALHGDFWICRTQCKACAHNPVHPSIAWFEFVSLNLILVRVFWCKSGGASDKSEFSVRCERGPGWCWVWIIRSLPAGIQTLWVCVCKYKRNPFPSPCGLGLQGRAAQGTGCCTATEQGCGDRTLGTVLGTVQL